MASHRIVVIGASAGGIDAVRSLLAGLPADFQAPVAVVIHTAPESPGILDEILARATALRVRQPKSGEHLQNGTVFVAPPDHHLVVEPGRVLITRGPRENRFRPAVDPLFRSAAQIYGPAAIGVVLTGNLDDGSAGLRAIKQLGGIAIVQDPVDAEFPSMPRNAVHSVNIDHLLPLAEIPAVLSRLVSDGTQERAEVRVPDPVDVESRIARGEHPLKAGLERIAAPSMYACPECHGVLLQLKDALPLRFRCHTGHAYSAESLLSEINETVETTLWNTVRAMEEASLLAQHLLAHAEERGDTDYVNRLAAQQADMHRRANGLRAIIKERGSLNGPPKS